MVEPRPLARDQKLGRSVVETLTLQLPDRGPQLQDLGAQSQDPVRVRVFLHGMLPNVSATHDCARGISGFLEGTKTYTIANIRQDITTASRLPFADQQIDFPAQIHLRQGLFCAVAIAVDELAHGRLDIGHFQPQGTDLTSNFINSVVHGLLEQNKNI
ncbi:bll2595 [Bradyrhizobium diazoefficiens USDA 110]|uniref:Bll2595 protein n=1 Tax=Bradyrhizobium diazoefficiens (strain JCM 10833 / BCRC 13528 / IAM 13628 / NBRC 14792 / USDA 110) TaxID=224911 RepID=Q89S17_BRADU|nr:hypothetical protein CO678_04990 [Bradyrhizobium diazoefficiens]QBP21424.1 hypothetical protein Bdiaspc4_13375 [Bradyrhizobium diazoefficiens]BAC47860.1 bll2595 [Bradyrhizobium diazoefficiens USDA 110]